MTTLTTQAVRFEPQYFSPSDGASGEFWPTLPARPLVVTEAVREKHLIRHLQGDRLALTTEAQILGILSTQFSLEQLIELGGTIYLNYREQPPRLRLEIVEGRQSDFVQFLADFLESDGHYSAGLLRPLMRSHLRMIEDNEGSIAKAVDLLLELAETRSQHVGSPTYLALKRRATPLLQAAVASTHMPFRVDIDRTMKGAIGLFHVHYNGSPPSEQDLITSEDTKLPMVVISATPNYGHDGFKLYLVIAGSARQIYPTT